MIEYKNLIGQLREAKKNNSAMQSDLEAKIAEFQNNSFVPDDLVHLAANLMSEDDEDDYIEICNSLYQTYKKTNHPLLMGILSNSLSKLGDKSFNPKFIAKLSLQINKELIHLIVNQMPPAAVNLFLDKVPSENKTFFDDLYYRSFQQMHPEMLSNLYILPKKRISDKALNTSNAITTIKTPPGMSVAQLNEAFKTEVDEYKLLEAAFEMGQLDLIEILMDKVTDKIKRDKLALKATFNGPKTQDYVDTLKLLNSKGVSFNATFEKDILTGQGMLALEVTPLIQVIADRNESALNFLLSLNKDLYLNHIVVIPSSQYGPQVKHDALSLALSYNNMELVQKLVSLITTPTSVHNDVLKTAFQTNNVELAKMLINKGARLDETSLTAELQNSINSQNFEKFQLVLLMGGPKFLAEHADLSSVLSFIARNSEQPAATTLLQQIIPQLSEIQNSNSRTSAIATLVTLLGSTLAALLPIIINQLSDEIIAKLFINNLMSGKVKEFLKQANIKEPKIIEALYVMTVNMLKNVEVADELFSESVTSAHRQTGQAISNIGNMTIADLKSYLEKGANPSLIFQQACVMGVKDIVNELLNYPLDEKNRAEGLNYMLLLATQDQGALSNNALESIKGALEKGAQFNKPLVGEHYRASQGLTPIMLAWEKNRDLFSVLLNSTSDLNLNYIIADDNAHYRWRGQTMLSTIIANTPNVDATIIKQLIARGANPNEPGGLPLQSAIDNQRFDIAQILIANGATLTDENLNQRMQQAFQFPNFNLMKLLFGMLGDKFLNTDLLNILINNPLLLARFAENVNIPEDEKQFLQICEFVLKNTKSYPQLGSGFLSILINISPSLYAQFVKLLMFDQISAFFISNLHHQNKEFFIQFLDKAKLDSATLDELYLDSLEAGFNLPPIIETTKQIFNESGVKISARAKITGDALIAMNDPNVPPENIKNLIAQGADADVLFTHACYRNNTSLMKLLAKENLSPTIDHQFVIVETIRGLLNGITPTADALTVLDEQGISLSNPLKGEYVRESWKNLTPLMVLGILPSTIDATTFIKKSQGELNLNYVAKVADQDESALSLFCAQNNVAAVMSLLEKGANPDVPPRRALSVAVNKGYSHIGELLYQKGARLSVDELRTKMLEAISNNNSATFQALVQSGGQGLLSEQMVASLAIHFHNPQVLEIFLEHKTPGVTSEMIYQRALATQDASLLEMLKRNNALPLPEELNSALSNSLNQGNHHFTRAIVQCGAKITETLLKEIILKRIKNIRLQASTEVSIYELSELLQMWPSMPLNDDDIVNAVLSSGYRNLKTVLVNTNLDKKQINQVYEHVCDTDDVENAQAILKNPVHASHLLAETKQNALLKAVKNRSYNYYSSQPSTLGSSKIAQSLYALGERLTESQIIENLHLANSGYDSKQQFNALLAFGPAQLSSKEIIDKISSMAPTSSYHFDVRKEFLSVLVEQNLSEALRAYLLAYLVKDDANHYLVERMFAKEGQFTPENLNIIASMALINNAKVNRAYLISKGAKISPEHLTGIFHVMIQNYEKDKSKNLEIFSEGLKSLTTKPFKYTDVIQAALDLKRVEILIKLIDYGLFKADQQKVFDESMRSNLLDLIPYLINKGFTPQQSELNAALDKAYAAKNNPLVQLLIEQGATLAEDKVKPVLIEAINNNDEDAFTQLVNMKKDIVLDNDIFNQIIAKDSFKMIESCFGLPLSYLQLQKMYTWGIQHKWVELILELENNYVPTEHEAKMALIMAITNGHADFVTQRGAPAAANHTQLMLAAINAPSPSLQMVQVLLDCGVSAKAYGSRLPLLALKHYYEEDKLIYWKIAKEILSKIEVNKALVAEIFENERQGIISYTTFLEIVTEMLKSSLSEGQKMAFDLLLLADAIEARSKESAMETSLVNKAHQHFREVVAPALNPLFDSYPGSNRLEKVQAIEREIRKFILNQMQAAISLKETLNEKDKRMMVLIKDHTEDLISGAGPHFDEMRTLAVSNEDNAQIAWRGYDAYAAHDPAWPNLLTPQSSTERIFNNAAQNVSIQSGSLEVRERVAYYFLSNPNPVNFLQQLADMRKAHTHPTLDSPTCYPGAIGRIAKMGEGHSQFQLPPLRRQIIHTKMNAIVVRTFSDLIKDVDFQRQFQLYESLTMLTIMNAQDIVEGKETFDDSLARMRTAFIERLGTQNQLETQISQALADEREPPFSHLDELFLRLEKADVSNGGRAVDFASRMKKPEEEQVKAITVNNVFKPIPTRIPALPPAAKRNVIKNMMKKYVEWELLADLSLKRLPKLSPAITMEFITSIVSETINSDAQNSRDRITEGVEKAFAKFEKELGLSKEESGALKLAFIVQSTYSGISEEQEAYIRELLKDRLLVNDNPEFNAALAEPAGMVLKDLQEIEKIPEKVMRQSAVKQNPNP